MIPGNDPASLPLRDIHLPDAVSWWPLAPGWWALIILVVLLLVFLYWWIFKRKKVSRPVSDIAFKEFKLIQQDFVRHGDKSQLAKDISELLRRVCLSLFPRTDTASLTGEAWLSFLDQAFEQPEFTKGSGRVLIEAPYQSSPEYDEKKLLTLIENWINRVNQRGHET